MRAATRVLVALVAGVGLFGSPGQARAEEPDRVGRIVIEGNTVTPDDVIWDWVDLRPGQVLQYPKVEAIRGRLARLGLFDPDTPPSVEVVPNELDSNLKDIVIRVKERQPGTYARFLIRDGVFAVRLCKPRLLVDAAFRLVGVGSRPVTPSTP